MGPQQGARLLPLLGLLLSAHHSEGIIQLGAMVTGALPAEGV